MFGQVITSPEVPMIFLNQTCGRYKKWRMVSALSLSLSRMVPASIPEHHLRLKNLCVIPSSIIMKRKAIFLLYSTEVDSHATNSKATPKPCLANEVKFPTGRLAHKPREQWQHNLPKHIHLEFDSYFLSVYVSMINTYYLGICRIG